MALLCVVSSYEIDDADGALGGCVSVSGNGCADKVVWEQVKVAETPAGATANRLCQRFPSKSSCGGRCGRCGGLCPYGSLGSPAFPS